MRGQAVAAPDAARPATRPSQALWLLPALLVMFFLSGACGLVYQVLWLRLLALVFGVTIWAASAVLASFMAGLALGSFAAGRLADRAQRPLVWYGVAEVLIGLSALATPLALRGIEALYVALYPMLAEHMALLTVGRFALSFAVLVVPTTLMGATLPIVVRSALLRASGLGERVSLLYATNTAGAIVGTLAAGLVLISSVGIAAAFRLAAAVNVAVGLLALLAAYALPALKGPAAQADAPAAAGASDAPLPEGVRRLVLATFTLSGFVALALEVVWFRVLVLILPATTYAFTIMLATVLAGIAAGSYLVAPLMRWRLAWLPLLGLIEVGVGLAALGSLALLAHSYTLSAWLEALRGRPIPFDLGLIAAASVVAILPAALLMGMAFPIGLRLWAAAPAGQGGDIGQRIGLFYALNVVGAIGGALAAGFVLLPLLGSRASLTLLAALSVGAGLLLLLAAPRPQRLPAGAGLAGGALALATALATPDPFALALQYRYPGEQLLWREEGVQTTVTVQQRRDGHRALYLDGLHQANDMPGMVAFHRLIGHLPMALHPAPRDVLVIGLGGGATAGAVSQHAGTQVEVVELATSVVRGAAWFSHVNDDVLNRPNVRLRVDDGRNFMLLTRRRYDVLTADVIQPIHAGAGNLYAAEYFHLARQVLKDDGLMLQWIGELPETPYKLIMRTFLSVFPDATLWYHGHLMVGTKRPLVLDPAAFARQLQDEQTRAALARVGLTSFAALLAMYRAGPDEMRAYVGPGPILTDDRPLVEYFLSLPRREARRDVSGLRGDPLRHVRR